MHHRRGAVLPRTTSSVGMRICRSPPAAPESTCSRTRIDGGHIGELESECFTAWKSEITFNGKAKHTGTARPDMVNAVTMAAAFVN